MDSKVEEPSQAVLSLTDRRKLDLPPTYTSAASLPTCVLEDDSDVDPPPSYHQTHTVASSINQSSTNTAGDIMCRNSLLQPPPYSSCSLPTSLESRSVDKHASCERCANRDNVTSRPTDVLATVGLPLLDRHRRTACSSCSRCAVPDTVDGDERGRAKSSNDCWSSGRRRIDRVCIAFNVLVFVIGILLFVLISVFC